MQQTKLFEGQFLTLIREGHWEYVERVNARGAAVIVAVTEEGKLLIVEQYRIPCHSRTLELPAGIIGDEPGASGEDFLDGARRELIEETGYEAESIEPLMTGPASSGLGSEILTLCLARRIRKVGAGGGIANEEIIVHEVPLAEVHKWLEQKAQAGFLIDPKIYAGLYFVRPHQ